MTQIVHSFRITGFVSGDGLSDRKPCRAATTVAGTLATSFNAGDTNDGVLLATDDRILIKNQALASENGIYVVQGGAPYRAEDMEGGTSATGTHTYISEGTANGGKTFFCNITPGVVATEVVRQLRQ